MSLLQKLQSQTYLTTPTQKESIEKNITSIINSRTPLWCDDLSNYVEDTIVNLGLNNTSFSNGKVSEEALAMRIKKLIQAFEKRLKNVDVELLEQSSSNIVKLRITALIKVDEGFDLINFKSKFDVAANELSIRKHNLV